MFVLSEEIKDWKQLFQDSNSKVMYSPYIVLLQKAFGWGRKMLDFLQHYFDLALFAKSATIHPSGFTPKFNEASPTLDFEAASRYTSATTVSICVSKRSKPNFRSPTHSTENNSDQQLYIMDLFSSSQNFVMIPYDPYIGTMTTMLGYMESNRKFICTEHDF